MSMRGTDVQDARKQLHQAPGGQHSPVVMHHFEAHPAVDRLGGEDGAELVGMDVADPGGGTDAEDDAVHGPPIDRGVLLGDEPAVAADVVGVVRGRVGEQRDEVVVERDEPVVAKDISPRSSGSVDVTFGTGDV